MTISEIKSALAPVTIWMAEKAIMGGVEAEHEAQNFSIEIAAEVLYSLFYSCPAETEMAISKVAENKDGMFDTPESYFDDFINALEKVQNHSVIIRTIQ